VFIDDLSYTVPEPSSAAVALLGAGSIAPRPRRRR
jgi:MYXO-CTERM domain-containing protein